MAPIIHWAINHKKKRCAVFFGGDERFRKPLPRGWEAIDLDSLRKSSVAWEAWLNLKSRWEQLEQLCPEGYTPIETDWCKRDGA